MKNAENLDAKELLEVPYITSKNMELCCEKIKRSLSTHGSAILSDLRKFKFATKRTFTKTIIIYSPAEPSPCPA